MKKTLILAGVAGLLSTSAMAETIGVSMALFDDNFLTTLRNGMTEHAEGLDGVEVTVEDATYTYPGSTSRALDGASLQVATGEITGLIGVNGAGKSTTLSVIAGVRDSSHRYSRLGCPTSATR